MHLEVAYAFVGFIMGGVALIVSLYVWLTVDEMKRNGMAWIELNRELKKKIERMEKDQRTPASPWKR
jgi:Mg2+/citrate symporter